MFIFFLVFSHFCQLSSQLFDNEINLECSGKKIDNVTLTAYYPDYSDDNPKNYIDKSGNSLSTLQDYLDDRANYVTLAMDPKLNISYGAAVCIPELNSHFGHRIRFEVRDASSDLEGAGRRRADVCVRTEIDSYDIWVNRRVTLIFL